MRASDVVYTGGRLRRLAAVSVITAMTLAPAYPIYTTAKRADAGEAKSSAAGSALTGRIQGTAAGKDAGRPGRELDAGRDQARLRLDLQPSEERGAFLLLLLLRSVHRDGP